MNSSHVILAFYHICSIENSRREMKEHKRFCAQWDLQGRIYISEDGINGQMSATQSAAQAYMDWLKSRAPFHDVVFKLHFWDEHCFPRMQIKTKPKVVACDHEVNWNHRGRHVSPQEWKERLDASENPVILDVRNDYEWDVGRFKGAKRPPYNSFRDFHLWADELAAKLDKKEPVMMYCTGGIRCELFSSMLQERGFEDVLQLEGGVIAYGNTVGGDHYEGKLFVFDDRMVVPIAPEDTGIVGSCFHCGTQADQYYNCADMNCNHLFVCCTSCLVQHQGCCGSACQSSPRLRPLDEQKPHKPFRKWYHYRSTKSVA